MIIVNTRKVKRWWRINWFWVILSLFIASVMVVEFVLGYRLGVQEERERIWALLGYCI